MQTKEVKQEDSEKLQEQGWTVTEIYRKKDGNKYHKLTKPEEEKPKDKK